MHRQRDVLNHMCLQQTFLPLKRQEMHLRTMCLLATASAAAAVISAVHKKHLHHACKQHSQVQSRVMSTKT